MRFLYLYPEVWTGLHAQEVQTLSTCVALAEKGMDVTLLTGGGELKLREHLADVARAGEVPGLHLVPLSRTLGPIQSTSIFSRNFHYWLRGRQPFDLGYIIHLKAGAILKQMGLPFAYEAQGIVAQAPQNSSRQRALHKLEGQVLNDASIHIATSTALAVALRTWYNLSRDFTIAPNAGRPPLKQSVSSPEGPFVYCGSIGDGANLVCLIQAAREVKVPLKFIGGTDEEWRLLGEKVDTGGIEWQPRVRLGDIPGVLTGTRAGLIPTNFDSPAAEYSCPMKLFDYTRCGLPVLSAALPSLQSLDVGPWCTRVPSPSRGAWVEALRKFRYEPEQAEAARTWSSGHTWPLRGALLQNALGF